MITAALADNLETAVGTEGSVQDQETVMIDVIAQITTIIEIEHEVVAEITREIEIVMMVPVAIGQMMIIIVLVDLMRPLEQID
jgi:hypothetical protein